MNTIDIKRGSSIHWQCTVQQGGAPLDITGWQIDCQLRAPGGALVQQFAGVVTDALAGQFALRASAAETAAWPLGGLYADIRYTDAAGAVMHSATWPVRVEAAITREQP
ncbi:hypothetical protein EII19_00655 [Comamonadaceae bacterium OH2310_COT-174]|nr:hypothetical protein EII19_00655 [Comamonadaceae bacterium OH2310_COT-174]